MILGLTGKYCSGKSTVGSLLKQDGWHVLDVDGLGHQVLEEKSRDIIEIFGESVVEGGRISRKLLGRIVFSDPAKRLMLEGVLHPRMVELCRNFIREKESHGKGAVVNAALLHYMRLDEMCDHVIFVSCPAIYRYFRGKNRDGVNLRNFLQRNRAQKHIHVYNVACKGAVFEIRNTRNQAYVRKQLDLVYDEIKN